MLKKIQQVSIKGLLCRNGKVLVLKTPDIGGKLGIWELPGGRMDFGETAEEAFKKEMGEELGFKEVLLGDFVNVWTLTDMREGINHHFIVLDFVISTSETDIKLRPEEHTEYKWVDFDEANKLNMREGHRETIKKFFKKDK